MLKVPCLSSEFRDQYIKDGCPGPHAREQAVNAIRIIGDEIKRTAQKIDKLQEDFFARIGALSPDLSGELLIELKLRRLLEGNEFRTLGGPPRLINVNLTLDGWEKYEAERRGKISSNYGFIAMKFDDPFLDQLVRETVKPAIKNELGFNILDMRDVARAGVIDNIMRAQIRDAAFVLVDLTHDNSGAYWEAGYAEGLGKPVVYICEKEKFDQAQTHFDTNHCTTVLWAEDNTKQFVQQLIATLKRSLNIF